MSAANLNKYFNCDIDPLSAGMYANKHVGFYAVVDDIRDGYTFAQDIPAERAQGRAVFEKKLLPSFVVFIYPEHTLVPKQQQRFVHQLIEQHSEVKRVIIITTSAVILSDAVRCVQIFSLPKHGDRA